MSVQGRIDAVFERVSGEGLPGSRLEERSASYALNESRRSQAILRRSCAMYRRAWAAAWASIPQRSARWSRSWGRRTTRWNRLSGCLAAQPDEAVKGALS